MFPFKSVLADCVSWKPLNGKGEWFAKLKCIFRCLFPTGCANGTHGAQALPHCQLRYPLTGMASAPCAQHARG